MSEVGADVAEGAEPARDVSQDHHDHPGDTAPELAGLEQHSPRNAGAGLQPLQAVADQPVVFDQDNKAPVRADELGEHRGQIKGTTAAALLSCPLAVLSAYFVAQTAASRCPVCLHPRWIKVICRPLYLKMTQQ